MQHHRTQGVSGRWIVASAGPELTVHVLHGREILVHVATNIGVQPACDRPSCGSMLATVLRVGRHDVGSLGAATSSTVTSTRPGATRCTA